MQGILVGHWGEWESIVAWTTITKTIEEGGLNIKPFEHQARLLRIVENYPTEWVLMANDILKKSLRQGTNKRKQKSWSTSEALLLLLVLESESSIVKNILGGWFEAKSLLQFDVTLDHIPTCLSIA